MNTDTPVEVSTKKKRVRSPAYPYLDLESAIEKARIIYAVAAHYDVSDHLIFQGWEVSPTSSKAPRTLSALCDYGLLQLVNDEKSDGKERRFKLTSWALEIIRDKRPISPERDQLLQKAALTPALYSELWDKYESNIPSDEFLEHELIAVRNYNEKAVPKISRDFKNTMIFAKLIEPTQEPTLNSDQSNDSKTHTVAAAGRRGLSALFYWLCSRKNVSYFFRLLDVYVVAAFVVGDGYSERPSASNSGGF